MIRQFSTAFYRSLRCSPLSSSLSSSSSLLPINRSSIIINNNNNNLSSSSSLSSSLSSSSSFSLSSVNHRFISTRSTLLGGGHHEEPAPKKEIVRVRFVTLDGDQYLVDGLEGETLLETAVRHNIPIPGLCGGGGAPENEFGEGPMCRFCHVYIDPDTFNKLSPAGMKESDITTTITNRNRYSRFACEIILRPHLQGLTAVIPEYPCEYVG